MFNLQYGQTLNETSTDAFLYVYQIQSNHLFSGPHTLGHKYLGTYLKNRSLVKKWIQIVYLDIDGTLK